MNFNFSNPIRVNELFRPILQELSFEENINLEKLIREKGDKFLIRIFTDNEIRYCESKGPNKYQHYAGRFAAKESVMKAYGVNKFNFFPGSLEQLSISSLDNLGLDTSI